MSEYRIVNQKIIPLSPEEIEQKRALAENFNKKITAIERSRPLTVDEVSRMIMAQQVNSLTVDDNTALRMVEFYPEWTPGTAYTVGFMVQRGGKLWRILQAHTAQVGWEPENAASLWEQIVRNYSGTEDDPVPYDGNMRLEAGKYYIQSDVIYLCNRDSGNPVYHALSELVGIYVEVIA